MDQPSSNAHFIAVLAGAAGLYGLFSYYALKHAAERRKMAFHLIYTAVVLVVETWFVHRLVAAGPTFLGSFGIPVSIAIAGVMISTVWTPQLSEWFISPLTNMFDGGREQLEPKPLYSAAQARRKRGQLTEAIAEVRRQLAQFPDDFEGIMLLAGILAEDMKDVPGAEIALNNFCKKETAPPRQVFAAFTQLADWQLKLVADVDGARASLQKIIDRFPGTELALQAQQRVAHLAAAEQMVMAKHDRQAVYVPEGVHNVGLLASTEFLKPKEPEPGQLAAAYVKQLELHPHDNEAREKLALIYATHFQRLDLATMELEQLIREPKQSPRQVAEWLNQLASYQVNLGANVATVCATLQRIVDDYPDTPAAERAQLRLGRINSEIKGREATANVKLGEYEQRAGLKYGRPGEQSGRSSF